MGKFISILCNTSVIKARTASLRNKITPEQLDGVMSSKAQEIKSFMVANTPVGKFRRGAGPNTRDSWLIRKNAAASYSVRNYKKQMLWLEEGTISPITPVRARLLYIPLSQSGYDSYRAVLAYRARVKRADRKGLKAPKRKEGLKLRFGVDYIFAKQTRGITALNLRKKIRPSITNAFIKQYLKTIS